MAINMSISDIEQREFNEIDVLLPTLWNEGLLTGFDCRIIAISNTLVEKKAAVYTVIMSKTKEEVAVLSEAFRNMTVALRVNENSTEVQKTSSDEENNCSVLPSRNPFLNNMIIKHLFGFLPLQEMKEFRLVCQEWNSAAEICLRKMSTIHFCPDVLQPNTFVEVSKYSHPDLPFQSFTFSRSWDVADIQNFMEKWDKNIKEMSFICTKLTRQCNLSDTAVPILNYDVTPLFINPSNITSLKISYHMHHAPETNLEISLEKFVSLKTLSLMSCTIIVSAESLSTRIAPLGIILQKVSFKRNEKIVTHFCYNDIFDFSKALNIHLEQDLRGDITDRILDIGENVFKVNQLTFRNVYLKNWNQAKGVVRLLNLEENHFVEQNQLEIQFLSAEFSKIDLNALPQTLKLLKWNHCEIYCSEPFDLPNLKGVSIEGNCLSLIYFSNCANFVDLEIRDIDIFNIDCVPKSVKRVTMDTAAFEFSDKSIFELDTLILDGKYSDSEVIVSDCTIITAQIKAKVLVVVCGGGIDNDTLDIVKLVMANKQSHKIIIGSYSDLHKYTPFEGSELSKYVDQKSSFYQFENNFGKSLTREEFETLYAKVSLGEINPN